jgi:hypothetical protein
MPPDVLPYHLKVRDYFRRHASIRECFVAGLTWEEAFREEAAVPEKLTEAEKTVFIAYEQARIRLYTELNGEIGLADRILSSIACGEQGNPVFLETVRRFRLYTAIFCDRSAYTATGDPAPVVSMIQKLAAVESEVRTQVLLAWHEEGEAATEAITAMIEGTPEFGRLDLVVQQQLNDLTYELLQEYLQPEWFRTEIISSLERQYFPGGISGTSQPVAETAGEMTGRVPEMAKVIAGMHPDIRTYFGYVLQDFAMADPSLKEMSAGRALEFAGQLGLSDVYDKL